MALRGVLKDNVYPVTYFECIPGPTSGQGNATLAWAPGVTRYVRDVHTADTRERINPAYVDRIVTHIRVTVVDPQNWHDADRFEIPPIPGKFQIDGDPRFENLGPMTRFNRLLAGWFVAKRVN